MNRPHLAVESQPAQRTDMLKLHQARGNFLFSQQFRPPGCKVSMIFYFVFLILGKRNENEHGEQLESSSDRWKGCLEALLP